MVGVGEDQTSRQATGWSLPALLYHSFPSLRLCLSSSLHLLVLPSSSTVLTTAVLLLLFLSSSSFLLPSRRRVPCSVSPIPRLYIIHISTLVFGRLCGSTIIHTLVSSRCVRARRGARVTPGTCNLRGVRERRYAKRSATLCREAEKERERKKERFFCLTFARCAAPPWKFASTVKRIHSLDREGTLFDYRVPRGDVEPSNLPSLQLPELIRGSPGPA